MFGILPFARIGLAIALMVLMPLGAGAQDAFKEFKQLESTPKMPKLDAFIAPGTAPEGVKLRDVPMEAKLTADGTPVEEGLSWYVFSPIAGADGKLPLIASAKGGPAAFQLAPGDYFVNVSFGRAGVTKN